MLLGAAILKPAPSATPPVSHSFPATKAGAYGSRVSEVRQKFSLSYLLEARTTTTPGEVSASAAYVVTR